MFGPDGPERMWDEKDDWFEELDDVQRPALLKFDQSGYRRVEPGDYLLSSY